MSEPVKFEDIITMLGDNYSKLEESIANQILLKVSNHYPTEGAYRENVWKSLFEMIIPRKYCIEQSVFIIDSYGHKSKEVDLVVFDEMYTPYIFNYGNIKFIPIEAVAAVIQCKSKSVDYMGVTQWRKTIEDLVTSTDSIARMASFMVNNETSTNKVTQTATRPIMILCAIYPKEDVSHKINIDEARNDFDFLLLVDEADKNIRKYIRGERKSLVEWNDSLNHFYDNMKSDELTAEKEDRINKKLGSDKVDRKDLLQDLKVKQIDEEGNAEENVLLSLIFQLNQLLMILNNPMLFPHRAYARCFDKILSKQEGGTGDGEKK